ncbi:hypothetical protein BC830DRAFT_1128613 [Chytriomyces sp. MP71]|nr:hypothetical protein BC830DRAFT_1143137 [Chytriomyces sp. MP71]KAI8614208.1 hypothetical protein BC830DRAFT_1128613 [Chytriomyces sp. MP71]
MRNGIVAAKLAKSFHPASVKKIYENTSKLQFKHSDNINCLFNAMRAVGLPEVFFFELTDLYERKNFPKVVYCIHALSHVLAAKELSPAINNLVGKLTFTVDQIEATQQSLDASGVSMPSFGNIETALAKAQEEEDSPEHKERREREARDEYFRQNTAKLVQLQAHFRSKQARKLLANLKQEDRVKKITKIQAMTRARNAKKKMNNLRNAKAEKVKEDRWNELYSKEGLFIKLQARIRGKKERSKYKARIEYFHNNMDSIVKLQALWRAKQTRKAYKNLTTLQNPPVKIIQDFVHLLEDSDRDYEDDLDIEGLRQNVVETIRKNSSTEAELNDLDLKIALLIKNRISIEDVYHQTLNQGSGSTTTAAYYKKMKQSNATGAADHRASTASTVDKCIAPFVQRTLDKDAREKLEAYQQLFYLLQTNPNYLAKTMYTLSKRSGGTILKVLEQVTLTLFGYAQNVREEYLLLNLIKTAIKLEVGEIDKLDEFWRANPLFIKLVLQYVRGAKERQFFRDLFQPLVKFVMSDLSLSLETDPSFIYKSLIRDDESKTGEQSHRAHDASPEQITADPDVIEILKKNTEKLQEITKLFLNAIMGSLKMMPYGIRYIAMQLKETMNLKFPGNQDEILKIVGNLIYYRYMNPAIIAPEGFDIIEGAVSPIQRKNLAEIAKTLHQISVSRLSAAENNESLKNFLIESHKKFIHFFNDASSVEPSEEHFDINEYMDLTQQKKLSVFISPNEIFQVHDALLGCVDDIISDDTDPMKAVLEELGAAPAPSDTLHKEVYLNLVNRLPVKESEAQDQKLKQLISDTKRLVLVVIKIQSGKNLLDILESPVTENEEAFFKENVALDMRKLEERFDKKKTQEWREFVNSGNGPHVFLKGGSNDAMKGESMTATLTHTTVTSNWKSMGDTGGLNFDRLSGSASKAQSSPQSNDSPALAEIYYKDLQPRKQSFPHARNLLDTALGSGSLFFGSGSLVCLKAETAMNATFNAVKMRTLENMAKLEDAGLVHKDNGYQDMLNIIANDMLNRHKRKTQRKKEAESLKRTLTNLEEKAKYLADQRQSYHDYIDACMSQHKKTLKVKKGPFPFTRQYFHLKELQKSGNVPQFGSYKFSALDLYKRGVLISMNEHNPKQYGQITLTISSSEAGIFTIEASLLGVKISEPMELRLEDLLQSQYEGVQTMLLFETARVNVNLLTYLLNKKFYV